MAPELNTLRAFRDEKLLTNEAGRAFVRWYYQHSPPVAKFIEDKPALRWVVRQALRPLVWLAERVVGE